MKCMANLDIFYICLYKTKYASILCQGMISNFFGGVGGGEHFIFYTVLSIVDFFFQIKTSITNTSSSIWLTEIKRPDLQYLYMYNVYLGSLLINAFTVAHCFHLIIPRNI